MFWLPLILGAASTGLQFAGQRKAANAQESNAEFNAAIGKVNAEFDLLSELEALKIERLQADTQYSEAQLNYSFAKAEAQSRIENANRLKQFAEARTAESREGIRRKRLDFERFQSTQRARVGASGVTEQGSPLEVFAETAGKIQLALNEMQRDASNERGEVMNRAEFEARDGRLQGVFAKAGLDSAKNIRNTSLIVNDINRSTAQYQYQASLTNAAFGLQSGRDQARGTRLSSVGTLLSGASSWVGNYKNSQYLGGQAPYASATPVGYSQSIFR